MKVRDGHNIERSWCMYIENNLYFRYKLYSVNLHKFAENNGKIIQILWTCLSHYLVKKTKVHNSMYILLDKIVSLYPH